MRTRPSHDVVVTALCVLLVVGSGLLAQSKPYGAATPQEAVATIKNATTTADMLAALPVVSPAGLKQISNEGVTGLLMVIAFSDPDDPMPGAKPSKAELDTKRKNYKTAVDLAKGVLKPHGLDTLIGKPVLADDTQKTLNAALDKADNVAFITSLYGSLVKIGPLLGMKETPKPEPLVKIGNVTGYKITGDKAVAQNGAETLNFTRIGGRWYIEPPPSSMGGATASSPSASSGSTPQTPAGPAPRASATGKDPEIVVGGIQIAKVVVSQDDFSAKPFNSDNGTKLVLWIKMPAGQGLIEIDEDASLLQHFGDDKGTNFGGKFDSFPDEFKDGTGGTIEIESNALPAQGASSLMAEGSVALLVATGTRKTRVPNVALKNDAKFTFGTTPIIVAEVATEGESQTFTLKLPRTVMAGIKDVLIFDAKGQPIEGRRTGSGYMNDAAEMSFSVKTNQKTITLEFEAWQGQRTIKVPFKVKTGIGLN